MQVSTVVGPGVGTKEISSVLVCISQSGGHFAFVSTSAIALSDMEQGIIIISEAGYIWSAWGIVGYIWSGVYNLEWDHRINIVEAISIAPSKHPLYWESFAPDI